MTDKQLFKLALDALELYGNRHRATYLLDGAWDEEITVGDQAIAALKEALAQPEQTEVQQLIALVRAQQITIDKLEMALADHPMREVQRLGQEIEQEPICPDCKAKVLYECVACSSNNYPPPQRTEQEPVGFVQQSVLDWLYSKHRFSSAHTITTIAKSPTETEDVALYTHPPQRREPIAMLFGSLPVYDTPPQRTEPLIGCVNHDCAKCKERNT
jgi:hypothetical protein